MGCMNASGWGRAGRAAGAGEGKPLWLGGPQARDLRIAGRSQPGKMVSFGRGVGYRWGMKHFLTVCLAMLMAWAVRADPPHPALPAAVVPEGLGVNIHFTEARPGELEMLAAAGFRWVRMDFLWGGTERRAGEYDFSAYDRLLAALEVKKVRALFILDYGNTLYEANSAVATEAGRQAFSRWAAAAAVHFKGHGILWEIWNEPNGDFWKPKAQVQDYAALALAAAEAIHAAAPGEAVIGPATSGVDMPFLESCFKAGLLNGWDAVSVHPYRQSDPESAVAEYQKLRELIAQYAPKGKSIPILSGEWGYSSGWQNFDEARQGRMLARQWLVNLASGIPLSIWYDWHEDGTDPKEPEHHFGTVGNEYHAGEAPVYQPKPAYRAAKTLTTVLEGFHFAKRLALGNPENYAMLFRRGYEVRVALWTTATTAQPVHLRSSPGEFEVVHHTGEQGETLRADARGLDVTLTPAPQYLIARTANPRLNAAPAALPLRAWIGPVSGNELLVTVENPGEDFLNGTLQLTPAAGDFAGNKRIHLKPGETAKFRYSMSGPATNADIVAGLRIHCEDVVMLELAPRRYHRLEESSLARASLVSDGHAKVASQQTLASAGAPEALPGSPAVVVVKVDYQCDDGWKFFRVVPAEGGGRDIAGSPVGFGIWVYGDGGHAGPRVRLVDATGQTFQPSAAAMDWTGWRYVEFDFTAPDGHWGGANDGVMHYPIQWDTLFLIDNVSRQKSQGTLYLAAPGLIYK